jgi:hypothetical protein
VYFPHEIRLEKESVPYFISLSSFFSFFVPSHPWFEDRSANVTKYKLHKIQKPKAIESAGFIVSHFAKMPASLDVAGDVLIGEDQNGLVQQTVRYDHLTLNAVLRAQYVSLLKK